MKRCQIVTTLPRFVYGLEPLSQGCPNPAKHTMVRPSGTRSYLCDEHFYEEKKRLESGVDYYEFESLKPVFRENELL